MPLKLDTIYIICAAAGGTLVVLRLVMMLTGLDHGDGGDIPADASIDLTHDGQGGEFNFFSLQSIAGFLTMFGLVGLGLLRINVSDVLSLLGGLGAGVLTGWATGMIFLSMGRLRSEGTLQIQNAVGQTGTVYLTIPSKGTGVVTITVQGASRTLDAASESGQVIPTGSVVKVVGITAGKILVVREDTADIHTTN